jgi:tetratricopeptide (TPR) repeat protein
MTHATHNSFENVTTLLSLIAVLVVGGMFITLARDQGPVTQASRAAPPLPELPSDPAAVHEVQIRFDQGVALLHAKRYEYAATALQRVIELAPRLPEAHVNLGFAMLGVQQYEDAGNEFNLATELRPEQANAYWGLALAMEGLQDYEGALGAMRAYIHLSQTPDDPYVPKARAALWEWEEKLGRIKPSPDQLLLPQPPEPKVNAAGAAKHTQK